MPCFDFFCRCLINSILIECKEVQSAHMWPALLPLDTRGMKSIKVFIWVGPAGCTCLCRSRIVSCSIKTNHDAAELPSSPVIDCSDATQADGRCTLCNCHPCSVVIWMHVRQILLKEYVGQQAHNSQAAGFCFINACSV